MSDDDDDLDADDVTEPPLGDEIDLHTFRPRDCGDVVEEYVRAAQEAGMTRVRIIHGKGIGNLRRTVHAVLERHAAVASFSLADERSGSWGATLVELKPRDPNAA
jgi:DNA-nicking Smr family endonuclease